jgi:hypothetical protein
MRPCNPSDELEANELATKEVVTIQLPSKLYAAVLALP